MTYTWLQKIQIRFIQIMAGVSWTQKDKLLVDDGTELKTRFETDYYIIATRRSNYLSTFFICLGHFLLTGRWGFYSHVLMNLEDEVKTDDDFRFIEATGLGTHYSTFGHVFDTVDAVALIKPKNVSIQDWTKALDDLKVYLGTPYDNLFDLKSTVEINCVELIRLALRDTPNYSTNFAGFEKMLAKKKKLTPQMFLECGDFEVVYEIRR
jgi:cyclophilin family peptidyl-prolyl cis-trans isomerase